MLVDTPEAQTRLSELLRMAERGEEVVIARDGQPVARLVAVAPEAPSSHAGRVGGQGVDRRRLRRDAAGVRALHVTAAMESTAPLRLLLDTHVLLWWLLTPEKLRPDARAAIATPGAEVFVSAASVWEAAIQRAMGKLDSPVDLDAQVPREGFRALPITLAHGNAVAALPSFDTHRDPFDRLLVAQARAEGLVLVTRDAHLVRYGVAVFAA